MKSNSTTSPCWSVFPQKTTAIHNCIPVMWAAPPYLYDHKEIMALWMHTDLWLFLFIPHAVHWYTGTSEMKREHRMQVSLEECKRIHHSYAHSEVASSKECLSLFWLAWSIAHLVVILHLALYIFMFKTCLTKSACLLPKVVYIWLIFTVAQ